MALMLRPNCEYCDIDLPPDSLAARMSTVDNLDDWRGRVATVLAVSALTRGVTGHFGVAEGSDRMLPEPPRP
mgnify:CR=1 FL=1